jgi:hypothetical protein
MATNNAVNTGVQTLNGQLMIGSSGVNAVPATLTQGTGVTITNGAGSITIAATGGTGLTWVDQSSASVTMAVNTAYVSDDGATLVTFTLPSTAALGSVFGIVGKGAGGWTIAEQSGQTMRFGSITTTATTGSLASSNSGDCVFFVCTTANTVFTVYSSVGNITYV